VAATLPNSRHIVFPDSAHGNFSPCARQLLSDFIAAASPRTLNAACVPTQ
jgi:hypothetical protein